MMVNVPDMFIVKESVTSISMNEEGVIVIDRNPDPFNLLNRISEQYPTEIDHALFQPACLVKIPSAHPSFLTAELKNWG